MTISFEQFNQEAIETINRLTKYFFGTDKEGWYHDSGWDCYFDQLNEEYWEEKVERKQLEEILSVSNVEKALALKAHVESLPYETYHWVIETTDMIDIRNGWHAGEYCIVFEGYIGAIFTAGGDYNKALKTFIEDADIYCDHASDIAATAW